MTPPLAGWRGGKRRLRKEILARIPDHVCYVEPFAGAAWILFGKEENVSEAEVINDINSDVVTLFRVIQNHLEEFLRYFKYALCSREEFERFKAMPSAMLTDIQRAARFYYLQRLSFGGRMPNPNFGYSMTRKPRLNLLRLEEDLSMAHLRLARVYIENLTYQEILRRYDRPTTFFYVDPPYVDCEDHYGKGLFSSEDHGTLAALLRGIEGRFMLSQADCPVIRELYSGMRIESVTVNYSCKRMQGKNREDHEVLVMNYEPRRHSQLCSLPGFVK